ncbi:mitochondrial carrier domain-containing protein [Syncephalis fuscata]|nr:mitochondrial carrier domain-containing protein [Syncephalis fuscata]
MSNDTINKDSALDRQLSAATITPSPTAPKPTPAKKKKSFNIRLQALVQGKQLDKPLTKLATTNIHSFCSMLELVLMQPLDVLKTRYQSNRFDVYQKTSLTNVVRKMAAVEGLKGFYKGTIPVMCIVTPRSLQFAGLAYFKPRFEQFEHASYIPSGSSAAIAGICTGMIQAICLVTPLELIKVRQQTAMSHGEYRGLFTTARDIIQHEGQSWGLAVKFTCYTQLRHWLGADQGQRATEQPWRAMVAGGLANVAVGILNSPPDVVKTRMQDAASKRYSSSWAATIFFRGAWLRVLRIAPGAYEYLAAMLERHFPNE